MGPKVISLVALSSQVRATFASDSRMSRKHRVNGYRWRSYHNARLLIGQLDFAAEVIGSK
jgi:hypothetical protein